MIVGFLAGLGEFCSLCRCGLWHGVGRCFGAGAVRFRLVCAGQIAAVFFVGQFIEGNILTPRLVGDRVHLHPVWIIFALLAMGSLIRFSGAAVGRADCRHNRRIGAHMLIVYARDYQHVIMSTVPKMAECAAGI